MPDISLCKNAECPLKYECFRYTAKPNEFRQAYQDFQPDDDGQCVAYMPINEGQWYTEEDE